MSAITDRPRAFEALLAQGRWFGALPDGLRRVLLDAGRVRDLVEGERLFSRGDPPDGMYAVVDGAVRVGAATDSGKEALLTLVEPPSWFGEIAVLDGQPRTHDAIANEPTRVVHVPGAPLAEALAREPRWWRELGLLVAGKLRLAFIALEDNQTAPIPRRLARRLVLMATGYGEWTLLRRRTLAVRQEELALMLSTSRQTVNQQLKEMADQGWLKLAYGEIEILDLAALARAAGLDENAR